MPRGATKSGFYSLSDFQVYAFCCVGLRCRQDFFLAAASGGYSLAMVHGLLIVVASLLVGFGAQAKKLCTGRAASPDVDSFRTTNLARGEPPGRAGQEAAKAMVTETTKQPHPGRRRGSF